MRNNQTVMCEPLYNPFFRLGQHQNNNKIG